LRIENFGSVFRKNGSEFVQNGSEILKNGSEIHKETDRHSRRYITVAVLPCSSLEKTGGTSVLER
jgi:hypothetical protein